MGPIIVNQLEVTFYVGGQNSFSVCGLPVFTCPSDTVGSAIIQALVQA